MSVGTSIVEWEVTENKVPDYGKPVLVSSLVKVLPAKLEVNYNQEDHWDIQGHMREEDVIAWAEMPAPYKP